MTPLEVCQLTSVRSAIMHLVAGYIDAGAVAMVYVCAASFRDCRSGDEQTPKSIETARDNVQRGAALVDARESRYIVATGNEII